MTECDQCGTEHKRSESHTVVSMGKQWQFCSPACKEEWEVETYD